MVAFSACNRLVETHHGTSLPTDVSPELSAIDSLMWQRPDSALAVLRDYLDNDGGDAARHASTGGTFDNHYAHLLLAELLYKNYQFQTNRAELLEAVDYYDSLYACTDVARNVSTNAFWTPAPITLMVWGITNRTMWWRPVRNILRHWR